VARLTTLAAVLLASAAGPVAQAADECGSCDGQAPHVEVANGVLSLQIAAGARDMVIHAPSSPVTVERHFAVDAGTGTVRFGDGTHGAVPPTGTSVTTTYRTGSGGGTTVSRVGTGLSASVVTLRPALVTLPAAADDDDKDDSQ
jgi:hypothetical protein